LKSRNASILGGDRSIPGLPTNRLPLYSASAAVKSGQESVVIANFEWHQIGEREGNLLPLETTIMSKTVSQREQERYVSQSQLLRSGQ
jgi:hypothetical protein